jgi:DNA-binding CsgD family transcriptional regulator/PAS domain-containing protein
MGSALLDLRDFYESLLDDDLFAQLPGQLALSLGARSGLLHWHFQDGAADIMAHSGHFTDGQLGRYATEFAPLDPWAAATQRAPCGRATDLAAYVAPAEFERSRFYNDYILAMGDDTFRCIGVRTNTRWGTGMIALHRGRSQAPFEPSELALLDEYAPHLNRLLVLRGRIGAIRRENAALSAAVDAMADAVLLVDARGALVHANAAGEEMLRVGQGLTLRSGSVVAANPRRESSLRDAIKSACALSPVDGAVILDDRGWPPVVTSVAPVRQSGTQLALLCLGGSPSSGDAAARHLRNLFGLSASEAAIALALAEGLAPADIADQRKVSLGTVRAQIRSLFDKLGCTRQAELIVLVKSIKVARPPR